jgi:Domain of unknown function (DUF4159)
MTVRRITTIVVLAVLAWGTVYAAQARQRRWERYEPEMQDPVPDPRDAYEKTEFAFARLRYRSFGRGFFRGGTWGTDSNKAERQFARAIRRLTRIHTRSVEEIIDADSDEVFNWPWLYAVEVGHWELNDSQARRLRDYLDHGGFLMVDDFHGSFEWSVFMASLRKVFPDRSVVDIPDDDPIFHVLYDLDDRFQVPGLQYVYTGRTYEKDGVVPHWRAIYDQKGRIQVAICHDMDLGDAWEWADDPQYPEKYASLAFRIGINYIIYSMTR